MKWLFLLLLVINLVLFVVQMKARDESGLSEPYSKVVDAAEIKLLRDETQVSHERCVVIGMISDEQVMSQVVSYLDQNGISSDVIERESNLAPNYWVYVSSSVNDELSVLLSGLNIESYTIPSGELRGKLSVGLFANIDLAQDMVATLKKAGVEAAFVEKKKIKKTKWVSFSQSEMSEKSNIIEGLRAMKIKLGEIKEFFCKSIASEKEFT